MKRLYSLNFKAAIAVFVMLAIMGRLGIWQLDRAEEKKVFLHSVLSAQQAPLEVLYKVPEQFNDWVYRKIEISGDYLVDQQFLLDNQFSGNDNDKRAGFDVLTPLLLQDQSVILVNRGWLPRSDSKQDLPNVHFQPEGRAVQGILRIPSEQFTLGEISSQSAQWPMVVQALDIIKLQPFMQKKIQPVVLMLLPEQPHGYIRAWQGKHDIKMGPAVHYGYAFQWFALSATLLVLSLGFMFKTSQKV